MPVSLVDVQQSITDAVVRGIIDEFRKSSFFLDNLIFDTAANPVSGGGALAYQYTRLATQPTAEFRAINTEYTPSVVTRTPITAYTAIFGGSFEIDRVIANILSPTNIGSELALQVQQKIKAARTLFHQTVLVGDTGSDPNSFDGLDIILAGTSTEYTGTTLDLASAADIEANWKTARFELDEWLSLMDGTPSAIIGNAKAILRIKQCAQYAGAYSQTMDSWGNKINHYDGIPLIDCGEEMGGTDPIIPIDVADKTDLYAVRIGMDGFHGIAPAGAGINMLKYYAPDWTTAGAVKKGEVELIAGVALKATRAASVYRDAILLA